jgi:hypothetical protein
LPVIVKMPMVPAPFVPRAVRPDRWRRLAFVAAGTTVAEPAVLLDVPAAALPPPVVLDGLDCAAGAAGAAGVGVPAPVAVVPEDDEVPVAAGAGDVVDAAGEVAEVDVVDVVDEPGVVDVVDAAPGDAAVVDPGV